MIAFRGQKKVRPRPYWSPFYSKLPTSTPTPFECGVPPPGKIHEYFIIFTPGFLTFLSHFFRNPCLGNAIEFQPRQIFLLKFSLVILIRCERFLDCDLTISTITFKVNPTLIFKSVAVSSGLLSTDCARARAQFKCCCSPEQLTVTSFGLHRLDRADSC